MTTAVTEHYNIPRDPRVPFIDVDVTADKPLFVDPHAVRLQSGPEPFVTDANVCTQTFFDVITRCVLSDDPAEKQRGLELLQKFEEPWETRLGYAVNGFAGHGGADNVGASIWHSMTSDIEVLVRVGVLTQIEDLAAFVPGVAEDITSDLTTRIIFEPLANFTADMVARYPQFTSGGHVTGKFDRQVWDPSAASWVTKTVELPVAAGKPLLLVPRDWARPTLLMSSTRYYDTVVLDYAQDEQAVVSPSTGKRITTPKDVLRTQVSLAPSRATILAVTLRALERDTDLLRRFKKFVDTKYEPVPDKRLDSKLQIPSLGTAE